MTSTLLESFAGAPSTSLYCWIQKLARQTPNAESTSGTSRTTLCLPVIFLTHDKSHCFEAGAWGSANPAKNNEPAALLINSRREAVMSSLPGIRKHNRSRFRPCHPGQKQKSESGGRGTLDETAVSNISVRLQKDRAWQKRTTRCALPRTHDGRTGVRTERGTGFLRLSRHEEIQAARACVSQPVSRLYVVSGVRRIEIAAGSA